MPILFPSNSHGPIAVGFFNIETDLLLMDRYFFFSTDFCAWIVEWAAAADLDHVQKSIYLVHDREMIGDLAGAIHGTRHTGFIGEVYRRFPFPENPEGFKQKPNGPRNRDVVEALLQQFAEQKRIEIIFSRQDGTVSLGDYVFDHAAFQDIIGYVVAGGMPEWLDGRPPDYVAAMVARLQTAQHWALNFGSDHDNK